MKIIETVSAMQAWSRAVRAAGQRIGLVPTMGYLHDGHLSLVRAARQRADKCVVSIYVNPTQFGPKEDFSRYPRDFDRDSQLCESAGTDVILAPKDAEMYPGFTPASAEAPARHGLTTWVDESAVARQLEGEKRPGHFRGVCTVVAKLFNIVTPDVACFGQKDAQQCAVIQRMTRDLNFPIELVICPTRRETDGLAMSSRNVYLNPTEREQAVVLRRSLDLAGRLFGTGTPLAEVRRQMEQLIQTKPAAKIDYVAFVQRDSFEPLTEYQPGRTLIALAVFVGKTRLIDNDTF